MIDADIAVCTECGNLHMEGGRGPESVTECGACGGAVAEVDVSSLVSL